jgi:acetyl esterase/lipase
MGDPLEDAQQQMDSIAIFPDITYETRMGYRPLRLDLYRVKKDSSKKPLVVFVHGGGWTIGHKRATANYSNWPIVLGNLARLGFAVASVEYRLSGEAPFPSAIQDVKSSIRYLKANAYKYGIDSSRVILWGGSAGAHIAAMAAFTADQYDSLESNKSNPAISENVIGFLGWYGPYDISEMIKNLKISLGNKLPLPVEQGMSISETQGSLMFFHCDSQGCPDGILKTASPIKHVRESLPPTLLLHGTSDMLVPYTQSENLYKAMKNLGANVDIKLIEDVGHGWVGNTFSKTQKGSLEAIDFSFQYLVNISKKKRHKD